ncbi:MAG: HEAT repeat domain-containing protein [Planctomycetaceae bacterium]
MAQLIAARYLTEQKELEQLTRQAGKLLRIPNDAIRYEVLNAIGKTGAGDVIDIVAGLVSNPAPSRNFNVLRSHAIKALGACGNRDSIETIAPHARGSARNMTAKTAVEAMMRIVERHPQSREAVVANLAQSFPPVEDRVARLVTTRARQVHGYLVQLTGWEIAFPKTYTVKTS